MWRNGEQNAYTNTHTSTQINRQKNLWIRPFSKILFVRIIRRPCIHVLIIFSNGNFSLVDFFFLFCLIAFCVLCSFWLNEKAKNVVKSWSNKRSLSAHILEFFFRLLFSVVDHAILRFLSNILQCMCMSELISKWNFISAIDGSQSIWIESSNNEMTFSEKPNGFQALPLCPVR